MDLDRFMPVRKQSRPPFSGVEFALIQRRGFAVKGQWTLDFQIDIRSDCVIGLKDFGWRTD